MGIHARVIEAGASAHTPPSSTSAMSTLTTRMCHADASTEAPAKRWWNW